MLNPQDVFDVYPEVNEIFEVNGQPFLTEVQAAGHARTLLDKDKRDIITHRRPAAKAAKSDKTSEIIAASDAVPTEVKEAVAVTNATTYGKKS